MKCRCDKCKGEAVPIESLSVRFRIIGVEAVYKMKCLGCGREWKGKFFFPIDERNYVGEAEE